MATKPKKTEEPKEPESIECFVIMPISDQQGYEPNHFTLVYQDIIKPAMEIASESLEISITPDRADETKGSNLIQLSILQKVIKSPIAICDMSSKNPNVFYELGMRQAFDMPTVLLIDDKTTAPFDVNGLRYVKYSHNMKYREVNQAVQELAECLAETYRNRDDKSEINSLIRLMDLVQPAEVKTSELSEPERVLKRQELLTRKLESLTNRLEGRKPHDGTVEDELRNLINNSVTYFDSAEPLKRFNVTMDVALNETEFDEQGITADLISDFGFLPEYTRITHQKDHIKIKGSTTMYPDRTKLEIFFALNLHKLNNIRVHSPLI